MAKHKRYEQTRKDKSRNHWVQRLDNAPKWYRRMFKKYWKTADKKYIHDFILGYDNERILRYQHKHIASWDWY